MAEFYVDKVEENTSIFGKSPHLGCHTLTRITNLIILVKLIGCLIELTGCIRMVVRFGTALVKANSSYI